MGYVILLWHSLSLLYNYIGIQSHVCVSLQGVCEFGLEGWNTIIPILGIGGGAKINTHIYHLPYPNPKPDFTILPNVGFQYQT